MSDEQLMFKLVHLSDVFGNLKDLNLLSLAAADLSRLNIFILFTSLFSF